jgi:aspartate racemase
VDQKGGAFPDGFTGIYRVFHFATLVKTLGVIGGVGPESTIDYYATIIRLYRERTKDGSYPQFLINSIDMEKGRRLVEVGDHAGLAALLAGEIAKLVRAGAEFALIAAITPHIVFDEVAARVSVPLISIVETAAAAAQARGFKVLALFGTKFTMTGDFYGRVFERHDIELVRPDLSDQDFIHDKYFNELVHGKFLPETHRGLLAIVDRLESRQHLDGVILAGTELPLILRETEHAGIPFLNSTLIHCEAAVTEMLR